MFLEYLKLSDVTPIEIQHDNAFKDKKSNFSMATLDHAANEAVALKFLEVGRNTGINERGEKSLLALYNGVIDFQRAGKEKTALHVMRVAIMGSLIGKVLGLSSHLLQDSFASGTAHDNGHLYDAESIAHLDMAGYDPTNPKHTEITRKHVTLDRLEKVRQVWGEEIVYAVARHHAHQKVSTLGAYAGADYFSPKSEFLSKITAFADDLDASFTRRDRRGELLTVDEAIAHTLGNYRDTNFSLDDCVKVETTGAKIMDALRNVGMFEIKPCPATGLTAEEKTGYERLAWAANSLAV